MAAGACGSEESAAGSSGGRGGTAGTRGGSGSGGKAGSSGAGGALGASGSGGRGGSAGATGGSGGRGGSSGAAGGADASADAADAGVPCPLGNPVSIEGGACAGNTVSLEPTDAGGCVFQLPPGPGGQAIDPTRVNIVISPGNGAQLAAGLVCSPDDCGEFSSGWHFDDNAGPTRIVLCPETCAELTANAAVNAIVGCPTRGAARRPDAGDAALGDGSDEGG